LDTVLLRPVVQNPTIEIRVCAVDRLLLKQVMHHKLHVQTFLFLGIFNDLRQFLDNQVEVRIFASQSECRITVRATQIYYCSRADLLPGVSIREMTQRIPFACGEKAHGTAETTRSLWAFL
jgi:hypothetical protein